jgi:hypothetical protein
MRGRHVGAENVFNVLRRGGEAGGAPQGAAVTQTRGPCESTRDQHWTREIAVHGDK